MLYEVITGSRAYSIATVGCNLRCSFCQNWDISQWPKDELPRGLKEAAAEPGEVVCPQLAAIERTIPGERATPEEIVRAALATRCRSIAYIV